MHANVRYLITVSILMEVLPAPHNHGSSDHCAVLVDIAAAVDVAADIHERQVAAVVAADVIGHCDDDRSQLILHDSDSCNDVVAVVVVAVVVDCCC